MLFPVYLSALLAVAAAIKFKSPPPLPELDLELSYVPRPVRAEPVEQCIPQTFSTVITRYSISPLFEKVTSYYHEPAMTYQVEKVLLSTVTETLTVDMTSKRSIFISKYTSTVFSPTFTTLLVTVEPTRYELRTTRHLITKTEVMSVTLTEPRIETVEMTSKVTSYDNVEASAVNQDDLKVVTVAVTSTLEPLYEWTVTVTENVDELVHVTLTVPVSRVCSALSETIIYETLPVTSVSYIVRTRTETFTYRPEEENKKFGGLFGDDQKKHGIFGGEQNRPGIFMSVIDDLKKNFKKQL